MIPQNHDDQMPLNLVVSDENRMEILQIRIIL